MAFIGPHSWLAHCAALLAGVKWSQLAQGRGSNGLCPAVGVVDRLLLLLMMLHSSAV